MLKLDRETAQAKPFVDDGFSFPWINLSEAIDRAAQFQISNPRNISIRPIKLYRAWSFTGDTLAARRMADAVYQYGLIKYEGVGDTRMVRLSQLALDLNSPDYSGKATALRIAALQPALFQRLMNRFGVPLPSDAVVEEFLILQCGCDQSNASKALKVYKDSLHTAELDVPAKETVRAVMDSTRYRPDTRDSAPESFQNIHVGDYVYYEINGALQLGADAMVRAVEAHPDQKRIVFLEGLDRAFPINRIVLSREANTLSGKVRYASRLFKETSVMPTLSEMTERQKMPTRLTPGLLRVTEL
jgi:hypothetical protein